MLTKKNLVLFIVLTACCYQKNHIHRLNAIQKLADKDKQPMKFLAKGGKHYYYLFSVANTDLIYEDNGKKWYIQLTDDEIKTTQNSFSKEDILCC